MMAWASPPAGTIVNDARRCCTQHCLDLIRAPSLVAVAVAGFKSVFTFAHKLNTLAKCPIRNQSAEREDKRSEQEIHNLLHRTVVGDHMGPFHHFHPAGGDFNLPVFFPACT